MLLYDMSTEFNMNSFGMNFVKTIPSVKMPYLQQTPIWNMGMCYQNFSIPFFNYNNYNIKVPTFLNFFNFGDSFKYSTPVTNNRPISTPSPVSATKSSKPSIVSSNKSYAKKVADLSTDYVGVVNTRRQANILFSKGQSRMWCSDFVGSVVNDAYGCKGDGFPVMGCVKGIWDWGERKECNLKTYGMNNSQKASFIAENIKPGDIMINRTWYDKNSKGVKFDKPKHIFSHTEIVVEVYSDGSFKTVSGGGNKVRYVKHNPTERDLYGFTCLNKYSV